MGYSDGEERSWYQKKRYTLSLAFLALWVIASALGDTTSQSAPTSALTPAAVELAPRQTLPALTPTKSNEASEAVRAFVNETKIAPTTQEPSEVKKPTYTIINKPLGIALVSTHTQPTASSPRYHHSNA